MSKKLLLRSLRLAALFTTWGSAAPAGAKDLIEYFQPTQIHGQLTSSTWGASNVLPRDVQNGLEDTTNKQSYWDGRILKVDGKYHMFASRWAESAGHNGWSGSVAVHAVSDRPDGPYVDKGLAYTNQGGKGHNVTALVLPDGRYAIVVSETRPGDVFISNSIDGPYEFKGSIKVEANGFDATRTTSNVSVIVRPDNSFLAVSRHGSIMISKSDILGPYVLQGPSVYPKISGLNNGNAEDPMIWYSGGQYHMTVNWWDARKAYHLTSKDGVTGWKNAGVAYNPDTPFVRYTDGTVNKWNKIERPGVLIENGHVTHFIFSVLDVPKEQELGNDNHGNKVILVPFDGVQFDKDTCIEGGCDPVSQGGTGGAGGNAGAGGGAGAGGAAAGQPNQPPGGAGMGGTSTDSAGSAGTASSSGSAAGGAAGSSAGGSAGTTVAGTGTTAGAASTPIDANQVDSEAGCNCRVGSTAPQGSPLLALFGALGALGALGLRRSRLRAGARSHR